MDDDVEGRVVVDDSVVVLRTVVEDRVLVVKGTVVVVEGTVVVVEGTEVVVGRTVVVFEGAMVTVEVNIVDVVDDAGVGQPRPICSQHQTALRADQMSAESASPSVQLYAEVVVECGNVVGSGVRHPRRVCSQHQTFLLAGQLTSQ